MRSWGIQTRDIESLLRLRTFPVALQLLSDASELGSIRKVRRLDHSATFCQVITLARTAGWTVGSTRDDLNDNCSTILGLSESSPEALSGERMTGVWFHKQEDARKHQEALRRIPSGRHNAVVAAPVASEKFQPDIVLIYATPAQMILLVNGLQWEEYRRYTFYCVGETACSDSIGECYLSGQPSVAIPCYGERRYGHVAEDELVMALPPDYLEKAITGLKGLSAAGLRYPIPPYGAQVDPRAGLARSYPDKHK